MLDLQEIRNEIDQVDREIVALYEKRMEMCKNVAEYKIQTGKKVFDNERELIKIQKVRELANNDFNRHGVEELFEQIMAMSRKLQYKLLADQGVTGKLPFIAVDSIQDEKSRIVFQGTEGAYSQQAMKTYFGEDINSFHVETFRDAMEAIEEGAADFAVLPIENSSAGVVCEVYDLLVEFENYIIGEQIIKVEHSLLGVPGAKIEEIETVYSHPQALMQSTKFLNQHRNWKQISIQNTAVAAQKVLQEGDKTQAAIASSYAASLYGLEVLEEKINFSSNNSTRFIIVTNQKIFLKNAKKISICFEVPHESGSLYHMLSHFIYNNLNMNKIESRPLADHNWEYRFFIDFDGNLADGAVKNALRGLRDEARNMKILGNY
ncbi:prephenate dehydratase [Anaerosacchariphilus polymeriproducens]|uniref:Bifunctional chorismate mutase/prephenate dehydratase n=1 Tax=Anaerosacchariphilus polymeriproducens TaxID=1812858 RepID=A0A371ARW2_9FIRM|nr:prephenate dehydratase [Anaerosacchariphilus polymeriproducens]RDU22321.1 prephenate dehydratase [Anaerosacchariphilus polymeriproducens]